MPNNYSKTILTNMCMLYKEDGTFLVQNRLKDDWPGINFPGGHVENDESIEESAIRETKEETGLDVHSLEEVGHFEWNLPKEGIRHLAILFRSKDFSGAIHPSKEGEVFFIDEKQVSNYKQSTDFDRILRLMRKGLN
ncbi:MAG: NUDIX domain-containing protein [Bacilli bacterium]|jgi:8-oxo-dGTP diphosphatase|nr:NUDIX domain-containing protein [Bacilli bacterium]MCH4277796.1 NUDIX domain-containing protein [Bacilli bacterium]